MGMLTTLVGTRLPTKYHRFFKLPERKESWKHPDTAGTALEKATARWLRRNDANCGVYRLNSGSDALGIRLGLIDRAERTIDIQSYLIRDDVSGNLIGLHLAAAADRGVRVRLLMDDALTHTIDAGLLSLDVHDNIEVRVFNPFPRRRSRLISFIANFNILNRRMHNKSFTIDNQVTIVGGRNLADEYFQSGGKAEFIDEDLLAIGAVVDEVSDGFDEYWNSQEAIPINAFNTMMSYSTLEDSTKEGRKYVEQFRDSEFLQSVDDRLARDLTDAKLAIIPAVVITQIIILSNVADFFTDFTEYLFAATKSVVENSYTQQTTFIDVRVNGSRRNQVENGDTLTLLSPAVDTPDSLLDSHGVPG